MLGIAAVTLIVAGSIVTGGTASAWAKPWMQGVAQTRNVTAGGVLLGGIGWPPALRL
ncbi:MAG TPA: hypothetical protein VF762_23935 [Blastocatellia bacterium]